MPCAPVLNHAEVMAHPQIRANNYVVDVEHPTYGTVTTTGVAARYSSTPAPPTRTAPDLGEHNEYVLKEIVGMNDAQVKALADSHATTPQPNYAAPAWIARHKWKKPRPKL